MSGEQFGITSTRLVYARYTVYLRQGSTIHLIETGHPGETMMNTYVHQTT